MNSIVYLCAMCFLQWLAFHLMQKVFFIAHYFQTLSFELLQEWY